MAGLQELRRRIRSAENTRQITRAMKMVAGAKLRRAEERAQHSRSYFEEMQHVIQRTAGQSRNHPLLTERPVKRSGMVVITSDRGLAGPFNANVLRMAFQQLREAAAGQESGTFVVGRKGRDFFRRRGIHIWEEFLGLGDEPSYHQAKAIADEVVKKYLAGDIDRVDLSYTQYINPMTQRPTTIRLIPVTEVPTEIHGDHRSYVFEPDAGTVLNRILPRYVEVMVYGALMESKASEQGARMTAMDSASKNAEELIRRLILTRNRIRQEAITREIAELVGGAGALE